MNLNNKIWNSEADYIYIGCVIACRLQEAVRINLQTRSLWAELLRHPETILEATAVLLANNSMYESEIWV